MKYESGRRVLATGASLPAYKGRKGTIVKPDNGVIQDYDWMVRFDGDGPNELVPVWESEISPSE